MSFTPGQPRPANSGRKKGTVGKLSLAVLNKLEALGYDPVDNLVRRASNKDTPIELKVKIDCELLQYVWPKRKAIEHTGLDGGPIEIASADARESLASRIASIAESPEEAEVLVEPHRNGSS